MEGEEGGRADVAWGGNCRRISPSLTGAARDVLASLVLVFVVMEVRSECVETQIGQ